MISDFSKLDPRVKLLFLGFYTIIIFKIKSFILLLFLLLNFAFLWKTAKIPFLHFRKIFKFLLGLSLFLIFIQSLFIPGDIYIVKPIIPLFIPLIGGLGSLSLKGLLLGLLLSLRLFTLMMLMPLFVLTTDVNQMVLGLVRLGLPYKFAFLISMALNLIPSLQEECFAVMDAQRLRGFSVFEEGSLRQKIKAYPTLVVPLVIGAMRRAQAMGVAMDTRAFGIAKTRTYKETLAMKKGDWFFLVLFLILGILMIFIEPSLMALFSIGKGV